MLRIIDTSNNNGPVNMNEVAASGIAGVICKLTEGTNFVDPLFRQNWDAAGALGLWRGAYSFLHMDQEIVPQAAFFLAHLPELRTGDAVIPDIEYPLDIQGDLSARALMWLAYVRRNVGFKPMPYSFTDYIEHHLTVPELGDYPLWLADWGSFLPPTVGPWKSVALWQDSSTATCPGVNGPVDMSVIARDMPGLRALGKPGPALPMPPSLPTGPVYDVTVAHYLRALPRVGAPHVEDSVVDVGELLDANAAPPKGLPSWTTSFRFVRRRKTGALGYALAANLKVAP